MSIQTMIFAAQDAADKGEIPTVEQYVTFMTAMHEMEVRMPEFLWFDKHCEDLIETAVKSAESYLESENEYAQDMRGFEGTRGQLDALTAIRLAA
jgi:hypothetical protein